MHGIAGVTADVYVHGKNTLPSFAPGTVAGPLTLPAAIYDIKVFAAGADPAKATPVIVVSGPPVTCGATFADSTGHYRDNVFVVATPA